MRPSVLLDTGPILAILNGEDHWHEECHRTLQNLHKPLLTSEAVLAEVFYMVSDAYFMVERAWTFVRSGSLTLAKIADDDFPALSRLMHQYRDRPMDFADATLVHLAQRESLSTILTIDVADFQTYRIGGQKRFRILPGKPNH